MKKLLEIDVYPADLWYELNEENWFFSLSFSFFGYQCQAAELNRIK
jgi:hypothetical protein